MWWTPKGLSWTCCVLSRWPPRPSWSWYPIRVLRHSDRSSCSLTKSQSRSCVSGIYLRWRLSIYVLCGDGVWLAIHPHLTTSQDNFKVRSSCILRFPLILWREAYCVSQCPVIVGFKAEVHIIPRESLNLAVSPQDSSRPCFVAEVARIHYRTIRNARIMHSGVSSKCWG